MQVDLVFESCEPLESALSKLNSSFRTLEGSLTEFLRFAKSYISDVSLESKILALGHSESGNEDVWCLDSRGILTLVVCKETYETLGIVGGRMPWKGCEDTHYIHMAVRDASPSSGQGSKVASYGQKEFAALERWDQRRGPWKITYHLDFADATHPTASLPQSLNRSVKKMPNVRIPDLNRKDLVSVSGKADEVAYWEDTASSLFEWVGMACLESPRLSVADRCDPYIAVYTPPDPSHIGEVTTIRFLGFILPSFLQSIIETILSPNVALPGFVALTAHSIPTSPVTYLPENDRQMPPLRMPRAESEHTWSLVYARGGAPVPAAPASDSDWWLLAESVGKWDRRWG